MTFPPSYRKEKGQHAFMAQLLLLLALRAVRVMHALHKGGHESERDDQQHDLSECSPAHIYLLCLLLNQHCEATLGQYSSEGT